MNEKEMNCHYTLGLTLGTGSVGWAVLLNDIHGDPIKIQDLGARIFTPSEDPQTGKSLAQPRREARSSRRTKRRRVLRKRDLYNLFIELGYISQDELTALLRSPKGFLSPYQLRSEGLDRLLSRNEFLKVLVHLSQRRGYRSNSTSEEVLQADDGKIKLAIKENQRSMVEHKYRTVGEMYWKDPRFWTTCADGNRIHTPRNTANVYTAVVDRAYLVDEIHKLFQAQRGFGSSWADENLESRYLSIYQRQRNFDEGPDESSPYHHSIAAMIGQCTFEKGEPRAAKSTYTFEYTKLLRDINHLRIASNGASPLPLDEEQRLVLRYAALRSPSLTYKRLRTLLKLRDDQYFNSLYYGGKSIDEAEKAKWPQMQFYHVLRKALNTVEKDAINNLSVDQLDQIGTAVTYYKGDAKRIDSFEKAGIPIKYFDALLPLQSSKVCALSLTAMKKISPLLESGKRYDEACTEIYGNFHGFQKEKKRKKKLSITDFDGSNNPVENRAVSQAIKVVNAIIRTYGPPDVIRVQLAREVGKSFEERRKIEKNMAARKKENERLKAKVESIKGSRATGQDIVKYRLFLEQEGTCPYSGKSFELSSLFVPGYSEVDHIIPFSRSLDNSYSNRVLVFANAKEKKKDRLPFEAFGRTVEQWNEFEQRVEVMYAKNYQKRQRLLRTSLTDDESKMMASRRLQDTREISRSVYNLLHDNLEFAKSKYSKQPVQATSGAITSMLRTHLGLDRIGAGGDLIHCLNAVMVAVSGPSIVKQITLYYQNRERNFASGNYVDPVTGELLSKEEYEAKYPAKYPEPWDWFRRELVARLDANPQLSIDQLHLGTYTEDYDIHPILISQMPRHNITGKCYKDTLRSGILPGGVVSKVPLTKLQLTDSGEISGYYDPESDRLLYEALKSRLKQFQGDAGKAFEESFFKPKKDGTSGPKVNSVKIFENKTMVRHIRDRKTATLNGDMVRIDVFYLNDRGYFFIPIYVADTKSSVLPQKAVLPGKRSYDWLELSDNDFQFSLFPGDLFWLKRDKPINFTQLIPGPGDAKISRSEGFFYFKNASISTGAIEITTHDRQYVSHVTIRKLLDFKKYQVDVLGQCHMVKIPEKRLKFKK